MIFNQLKSLLYVILMVGFIIVHMYLDQNTNMNMKAIDFSLNAESAFINIYILKAIFFMNPYSHFPYWKEDKFQNTRILGTQFH